MPPKKPLTLPERVVIYKILALLAKQSFPEQAEALASQGMDIKRDHRRRLSQDYHSWNLVSFSGDSKTGWTFELECIDVARATMTLSANQKTIHNITLKYISLPDQDDYDWVKTYAPKEWQTAILSVPDKEDRLTALAIINSQRPATPSL